jgi:asparagine synthase (glutamine-hydrolysing)
MSTHARVFLYGDGPDNALRYEWRPYLSHLLAGRHLGALLRALTSDLLMHPRVPFWSLGRQLASARRQGERWRETFPPWLNDEFAARSGCVERWNQYHSQQESPHPLRPRGYAGFAAARWQPLFEDCDVQGARSRTDLRHPFLDVRLLRYMLALPVMPWCRNKLIIRRAMKAGLPAAVLERKKTTIGVSPDLARVASSGLPRLRPAPALSRYVNADKVPPVAGSVVELRAVLRPLGLNYWLQNFASR